MECRKCNCWLKGHVTVLQWLYSISNQMDNDDAAQEWLVPYQQGFKATQIWIQAKLQNHSKITKQIPTANETGPLIQQIGTGSELTSELIPHVWLGKDWVTWLSTGWTQRDVGSLYTFHEWMGTALLTCQPFLMCSTLKRYNSTSFATEQVDSQSSGGRKRGWNPCIFMDNPYAEMSLTVQSSEPPETLRDLKS